MKMMIFRRKLSAMMCALLLCVCTCGVAGAEAVLLPPQEGAASDSNLSQSDVQQGEASNPEQGGSKTEEKASSSDDEVKKESGADSAIQPVSDASSVGDEKEEEYKPFSVKLTPGEETLTIKITGASERNIMIGVYTSDLQYAAGGSVKGDATLTYDELEAGDYYVLVEYDPSPKGFQNFEGEVTVLAKTPTDTEDAGKPDESKPDESKPDESKPDETKPGSSSGEPTPFTIELKGGKGTLDIVIAGASEHTLMIGVYDENLQNVKSGFVTGSQTVSYTDLAAGKYYVMVEYDPPNTQIGVKDGYVTVTAADGETKPGEDATTPPSGGTIIDAPIIPDTPEDPVNPDIPTQYRNQIEATVKVGKDFISIQIVKGENLPMIVSVGDQMRETKLGQTVRFEKLKKGEYEIEIDYKDAIAGISPYRTSVKVPLETPDSYILLKKGMECYEVYLLTQRLAQLGYPITARYDYNNDVVIAVRLFQEENGLSVDGMAGKKTQKKLYSSSAKDYDIEDDFESLDRHDNGKAAVYALQQRLKDLGYYSIRVDGIYGSGTERAVRWFQKVNGLKESGKADAAMQQLLYSASAKKATGSYTSASGDYSTLSRSKYYNAKVVPLQRRLKELGYLSGSVDGYFGSRTYRAVRNFQSRNGLSVTGKADAATQQKLYSSSAKAASGSTSSSSAGYRLLYWGCEGTAVKNLQNALINAGYRSIVRSADGIYGRWTYDAVRAYQKDHGLSVDGIAGKKTQNALYGTAY